MKKFAVILWKYGCVPITILGEGNIQPNLQTLRKIILPPLTFGGVNHAEQEKI